MKALITGITSGIGLDISKVLSDMGYDIIGISKDSKRLEQIKNEYGYTVYKVDLSNRDEVINLCDIIKSIDIDVFINNAGFGDVGYFSETSLDL